MARPKRGNLRGESGINLDDNKKNNTNNRKKITTTITLAIDSCILEEIRNDIERNKK